MPAISMTLEVSQLDILLLKEGQDANKFDMLVTCDVSHFETSALKTGNAFPPLRLISVTRLVSQSGMMPNFVVVRP